MSHSNMTCKGVPPFKIENNILIGEKYAISNECVNIGDLILNSFKSNPDFIGQVDASTGEQTTFQQMRERSVKCALWLKKQNIKPGDVVVICTHNHINAYIPFLASLYVGAIANPWNEQSSKASMRRFISEVAPKIIFVNANKASDVYEVTKELHSATKIVVFHEAKDFESLESIMKGHFDNTEVDEFFCAKLRSSRDPAIILFSSGTTGLPKGVELSHGILTMPSVINWSVILPNDVALWLGSLSWITSVMMTFRTILNCIKTVKSSGFDEEKLCQVIEKYKVTWLLIETTMTNLLFQSDILTRYDVSSLRRLVYCGSIIRHEVHEGLIKLLPNVSFMSAYGTTETFTITHQLNTGKAGSCGYVLPNVNLIIVDLETGKPLGPNKRGEICCKSQSMMNSYYKNAEMTNSAYDSDGWFHTGDVGHYDEDGNVFVIDRIKQLIKYRGHHVSSAEIEFLLQTHPAVLEAAVTAISHSIDSQHPIAFVMKKSGENVTEGELEQLVAENLEDFKKLRAGVVFINKMPRLVNGKLDRKELRNMAESYTKK